MAKVNGGKLVAKALKKEGVGAVFTLTGGHITSMFYGCVEEGIEVIDVRHECAAAYAADAYTRITGKSAVVMATAGPGVIDTTTGMAEAKLTGTPIVQIGGAAALSTVETGALQCIDTVAIMSGVTRWSKRTHSVDRIGEMITMAFRHANNDSPGPVYLEIASDVLLAEMEEDDFYLPAHSRTDTVAHGAPDMVEQAALALAGAKKPAIIIGDAARYTCDGSDTVTRLARHLQCPVIAFNVSRGFFGDENDPLFQVHGKCLEAADVILTLCVDHNYLIAKGRAPRVNGDATIIQVHPDKTMIGYNTRADIGIVAGASVAAKQILDALLPKTGPKPGWIDEANSYSAGYRQQQQEAATSAMLPMHPGRPAYEVSKFIATEGKDWSVVCDGGEASLWSTGFIRANFPGQIVSFGPLGTIGTGPGFAVGAATARKGKPVLYYTGDGSFGFYPMEFDTFARHDMQVICVIANDSQWGMIKMLEKIRRPEKLEQNGPVTMNLAEMQRYHKLPEMWGGLGILCTKPEEIIPAIRKVYETGKSGIINVEIDKTVLSQATLAGATILI